jgi:hypothetical protein
MNSALQYHTRENKRKVNNLIKRVESYPCCMSCYGTIDELNGAKGMRDIILRLIKEELL